MVERLSTNMPGRLLAGLALVLICLISGCHEHTVEGRQSVYRFAPWVGVSVIAGGLLAVPLGWVLRKWSGKWSFVLILMGPFVLVMVAPSMYLDRVVVDDDHFEVRYGIWWSPSVHNLRFADLQAIHYLTVSGRRGYQMQCLGQDKTVTVVHAGDLVRNTVPEILQRARAKGVVVVDETR